MSAAERNKTPIFERLAPLLAGARRVLEIGAGDATHARHARGLLPDVVWQTSEHPARLAELERALAYRDDLPAPAALDVLAGPWPSGAFDAVYAANVTHIMSWPAVQALFAGSAKALADNGLLCLYGPFLDDDVATAPGNAAFGRQLGRRDAAMGLRRLQALDELAMAHGLRRAHDWPMPANNRLLVWRRRD